MQWLRVRLPPRIARCADIEYCGAWSLLRALNTLRAAYCINVFCCTSSWCMHAARLNNSQTLQGWYVYSKGSALYIGSWMQPLRLRVTHQCCTHVRTCIGEWSFFNNGGGGWWIFLDFLCLIKRNQDRLLVYIYGGAYILLAPEGLMINSVLQASGVYQALTELINDYSNSTS